MLFPYSMYIEREYWRKNRNHKRIINFKNLQTMGIREHFYLLSPTVLLYLVSLLITFLFVKKNKFLYFCLINWALCTISYIFFFGEIYVNIRMSPSDYSDRMFDISEGFPPIMIEPLHHLLFLIAIFLIIRKIFIKKKK